jgi:hypothetical protein
MTTKIISQMMVTEGPLNLISEKGYICIAQPEGHL